MNISTIKAATANLSEEYGSEWEVYWYKKNLQGDIVAVYDEMGVKLVSYIYDAFAPKSKKSL